VDSDRFRRVDELFNAVLQRDPAEWPAFLSEACTGDDDLRREVESLLCFEESARGFLDTPAVHPGAGVPAGTASTPTTDGIDLPMVGTTISHYRILEKLGSGGMGVVYRAHDERLRRDVAIKLLPSAAQDDKSRKRLRKEARALSKLCHPNVAVIHDFDTHGNRDFVVMELIEGVTLRERLAGQRLAPKEVISLGIQLAEGLAAVHERGLIHRDLTPGNLQLSRTGRLKILDFGIAKFSTAVESDHSVTDGNAIVGTLPYMAPEQLAGSSADARADIYAYGTVLYEMATGHRPFTTQQTAQLIQAILHASPIPPRSLDSGISSRLNRIILKCLEKEPGNRYQSVSELVLDLQGLANPESPTTRGAARRVPRWTWAIAAVSFFGVLLIASTPAGIRAWLLQPARITSLAVLPLENLSGQPDQEYFADGITDALITELAQINALRVVSRTSAMQYKRTKKTLPEIAKELGVDAILEGAVARVGDRVRITAQLVRGANDENLWAQAYERDVRDVLLLQDEVARSIAQTIQIKITPAERDRLVHDRPIDPEAYELYLKGRYFWVTRTEASIQKAMDMFKQAIDKDPGYAAAYSGLADCYSSLGFSFDVGSMAPKEVQPKAIAAVLKATELDGSLAEAHSSLAFIKLNYDWEWQESERAFKKAIELNPGWANGHHWYAHNLISAGRVAEAEAEGRRALQLDPLSPIMNAHLGWHYYFAREYDKSLEQLRKTLELVPDYGLALWYRGWNYEQKRMYADALKDMRHAKEVLKGNISVDADIGHVYAVSGDKEAAGRVIDELKTAAGSRYVNPFEIALIYVGLGDKDRAFEWLDTAYRERSDMLVYLKVDPRLDPIRGDSRFDTLVGNVGIPR
jgi:eukaryotic-like serine/threonine-protein kinase